MTQYQTKVAWLMIKILLSKRPIHNIPECFNEFRARVAVIDVIGMLPYIEREQRLGRSGQRRARIAGWRQIKRTVRLPDQPGPARAKSAERQFCERLFKAVIRAPFTLNCIAQRAAGCRRALWRQAILEKAMIPDLRGVVKNRPGRFFDDRLKRQVFKFSAWNQGVERGDIALMMLAVVIFKRFLGNMRRKRMFGVGQIG